MPRPYMRSAIPRRSPVNARIPPHTEAGATILIRPASSGPILIAVPSHEGALSAVFSVGWDRRRRVFGSNGLEDSLRRCAQTPHEPFRKVGAGEVLTDVPGVRG
jgi:hypothetical protein